MELSHIILANIAIFLAFFVQTTVGFGVSLVAFPFLLIFLDFQEATGFISVYLLLFSAIIVPKNWSHVDKKLFWKMAFSGAIGLFIGVQLLKIVETSYLERFLGLFTVFYVAFQYFKKTKFKSIKKLEILFGFLSGASSGLINNGSIVLLIFLNSRLHLATVIRGTIIALLGVGNVLRVPLLLQNGLLTKNIFQQSLWVLPSFVLALILGQLFYKKINKDLLKRIMLLLLLVMGFVLIMK